LIRTRFKSITFFKLLQLEKDRFRLPDDYRPFGACYGQHVVDWECISYVDA
jgi:hypothetical protein